MFLVPEAWKAGMIDTTATSSQKSSVAAYIEDASSSDSGYTCNSQVPMRYPGMRRIRHDSAPSSTVSRVL